MIGKISKSGSFKNLVEYLDKDDAVVLGTNMYGQGSRELTAEFMTVHDLNPGIKQPVLHASLSLSPGKSLSDEQLRESCETWMQKMGFDLTKNQYLIIRHKDTEHEHAHLAINRIDMLSGKVVVDSFERDRSQEIIRQLERNYGLEQVAPSWQTFKNSERNLEQTPERAKRQQLAAEIERATLGSPTMPEFFQRLAENQIRAEVTFTRTGKPKGITYQVADQDQVAGNALGKAYSFPGLQKYLKVNYDPARDNKKLAEIVQSTRQQHSQSPQQAGESAIRELELHSPLPSPEPVEDQPPREQKIQPVWSPQYGIPDIQDLIRAIPEHPLESQTGSAEREHRQLEKAQATYQQWARHARAIYRVVEPQDIDQRIAFLMQSQQQTPGQITQVLAQSPAVQELLRRDPDYVHSYSEFCQSYARDNQATWQAKLDQYRSSVEIERQRQQQLAATHQAMAEPMATPVQAPDGSLEKEALQAGITQRRDMTPLQMWSHYSQGAEPKQRMLEEVATRRALRDEHLHSDILRMLEHSRQYQSCKRQYGPENAHQLAQTILTASIRNERRQSLEFSESVSKLLNELGTGELEADGSLLFEGKSFNYRQYQGTISLIATDGRGEIFRVTDGRVTRDQRTDIDMEKCHVIKTQVNAAIQKLRDKELSQKPPQQQQSWGIGH